MGKDVRHICDKCGHTQDGWATHERAEEFAAGTRRFFFYVGIYCGSDEPKSYGGSVNPSHLNNVKPYAYWCGQCCVGAGVRLPQHREPAPPVPKALTLESMIREIVGDAVTEVLAERE